MPFGVKTYPNAGRSKIGDEQLRILQEARNYLDNLSVEKADYTVSSLCYLNSWAPTVGNAKLRFLSCGFRASGCLLYSLAKNLLLISTLSEYVLDPAGSDWSGYDHLVVSWALESDFKNNGSYVDRYFKTCNRDTPRSLWLLISLDGYSPANVDKNIRVFRRNPGATRYYIGFLMRRVYAAIISAHGNLKRAVHSCSATSVFAEIVADLFRNYLPGTSFRSVIVPYEAQPFQHAIFREAKRFSRQIETVGYLHSALAALPTDFIRRRNAPERLLVHGIGQRRTLEAYLGWKSNSVQVIPSLRYRWNSSSNMGGFVFLPYSFGKEDAILKAFKGFLTCSAEGSLVHLTVKNHPVMDASSRHRRLVRKLSAMIAQFSGKFSEASPGKALSVFIGATASVLEALERGIGVVHICSDPVFESHSETLWPLLEVHAICKNVFRYLLRKPSSYVQLGSEEEDMFLKYCCDHQNTTAGPNFSAVD